MDGPTKKVVGRSFQRNECNTPDVDHNDKPSDLAPAARSIGSPRSCLAVAGAFPGDVQVVLAAARLSRVHDATRQCRCLPEHLRRKAVLRLALSAVLSAHRHGGYVMPFRVEGSPSLLNITSEVEMFAGGEFRMNCARGRCNYEVFEDTFQMAFQPGVFESSASGHDAPEETPSEVADKFRRFLSPAASQLLNASTLSLVGKLLPDGEYAARWSQLPLLSAQDATRFKQTCTGILDYSPASRQGTIWEEGDLGDSGAPTSTTCS